MTYIYRADLWITGCMIALTILVGTTYAGPVFAEDPAPTTEATCETIGGACKTGCVGDAEQAIGTCSDNWFSKTCCKVQAVGGAAVQATETADCKALGTCPADVGPKGPGSGPAPALKPVVLTDPMGGKGIVGAIASLVSIFLGMVGAIALLVFVYAGVVYMTAGGSDERVKHAKDTMQYALIGLALITFAYALANFYFVALTS